MIFSATTTGRRLGLGLLLAAVFGLGWTFRGAGSAGTNAAAPDRAATGAAAVVWTCSMHPNVRLPQPGQCPICFMDLIPLEPARGSGLGPRDLAMSAAAAALAEIRTEPVQRMFVTKQLRLVGKIAYDETRIRSITARVPGRLEKLHVDQTGSRVRRGQKLAAIYSPELYAAQAELRAALSGLHAVGGDPAMRPDAEATVAAVRDRLRLWGLDEDQVAALAASGTVAEQLAIRSPLGGVVVRKDAVEGRYVEVGSPLYSVADLSRVWVILAAYETDLAWLRTGQPVVFTLPALAGREFTGEIGFIDPVMDDATRTVEVRIAADNSDGELKPGMLVQAVAEATLDAAGRPLDPQSAADGRSDAQPPLVVPASAPLWTGSR
jgi:Cu(I)/Ag(I) efflux system membrane fusion protein